MSVFVGVIAQESARFNSFSESLTSVELPPGSTIRWRFGWDLADGYNALVSEFLDESRYESIWFMGDDHAFSPDLLGKLLARDLDAVVPLCLMRAPPFRPVNWVDDLDTSEAKVKRIDLNEYPDGGLAPIAYAGAAGLLVKRRVLEAIEPPWFETGTGITDRVGEDVNFCIKLRDAGFFLYCDLDAHLGHTLTTTVWPVREPDGWTFGFSMVGGFQITMPPSLQPYADRIGA